MRQIDCDCGHTVRGQDDDELKQNARQHIRDVHPEMGELSEDQLQELVSAKAYDA